MKNQCMVLFLLIIFFNSEIIQSFSYSNKEKKVQSEIFFKLNKDNHMETTKSNRTIKKRISKLSLENNNTKKFKSVNNNQEIMSDWFKISSPSFIDGTYPDLIVNNNKVNLIKLEDTFRINTTFDEKANLSPGKKYFYFQYTDIGILYKNQPNTLAIDYINKLEIDSVKINEDSKYLNCIQIITKRKEWNICNDNSIIRNKWLCRLLKDIGSSDVICNNLDINEFEKDSEPIYLDTIVKQPIILIPQPSLDCNNKWSYLKNGNDWECDCKEGNEQSPIEINTSQIFQSPVKPVFYYKNASIIIDKNSDDGLLKAGDETKIELIDNGFLSIRHTSFGNAITLDGVTYKAEEVRFHSPAEHIIDGKKYDMEIEIIHTGQNKENISKQLVVSILAIKVPGKYNKFMDDLDIFNLPNGLQKSKKVTHNLNINKLLLNTEDNDYYNFRDYDLFTYQGSLSAPPCTENTIRVVIAKPIEIGNTIIHLFQEAIQIPDTIDSNWNIKTSEKISTSNRLTQPLNGRRVYFYKGKYKEEINQNLIEPEEINENNHNGHYEKVNKKYTSYFYVSDNKPSSIGESFVVSKAEALGNLN